ncbi:dGTPase [Marinicella sp. S1101]|uniref:dGTPase n=1 Tax=Marinicella marina TaxID=2996016 RepID=UPI002260B061|nr:dGTPase [Marinicella marina]MCX7555077.1 dGTPase [Marinicella marina]MDJ1141385.1 dGTPase [Marinicella marina]
MSNHNSDQPINFRLKLNVQRPFNSKKTSASTISQIESALESDRGRIINSPSVRRLQQKTQVFPLERNAAVRSRLTHSLEVQQNGRYIVKTLYKKLGDQAALYGLEGLQPAVESLVEMACLMHDIGNPPFGHFGEAAIAQWFVENLDGHSSFDTAKDQQLAQKLMADLKHFEGNAQAIRLTFSLQQMNLTYAQSASILKYTRAAFEPKPKNTEDLSYLKKKPGFYLSEQAFIGDMLTALRIEDGHRHPFTYVMEAADDIAYCLADLEDAVEKGILSLDELTRLLAKVFIQQGGDPTNKNILSFMGNHNSFDAVLSMASAAGQKDTINHNHEYFVKLRVNLIHHLVDHAAQRFIEHIDGVYTGNLNQALLEDGSVAEKIVKTFKEVGFRYVFNHQEVQDLELQGHRIITGLLDIYGGLLKAPAENFQALASGKSEGMSYQTLLLNRIDKKIIKAYLKSTEAMPGDAMREFYYRCRLLQDHISAMTDHSALDEYQLLTAAR